MLHNVNLERLHTFVTAARAQTFAAAAKERGVSLSAISQQVRALEGELGHELFERIGRRVRLTAEGRALLEATIQHLEAIGEAVGALGRARTVVEGVVCLGSPRTFGQRWLEPRLPALLAAAPRLRLVLRFDVPSSLERRLVDGELDLAVLVRPPELGGVEAEIIAQERFVAVCAPTMSRSHLAEQQVFGLKWLTFDGDQPMHDVWWRATFGRRSNSKVRPVCEVPSLELMLALVVRGVGAAVLPDYLVASALKKGEVSLLPLQPKRPAGNSIFLAWRRSAVHSARFQAVREALTGPSNPLLPISPR